MRLAYTPYYLKFKFPAGTSRGVLHEKITFFIKLWSEDNPSVCGYGEVAVFPGLSPESPEDVKRRLEEIRSALADDSPLPEMYSSVKIGMEQAQRDLRNGGKGIFFPSEFTESKTSIRINGLIWMGRYDLMLERVKEKLREGFGCIKIKIGAVDWDDEMALLKYIRNYAGSDIQLRVDANGAFQPDDCMRKLEELSRFGIHSIEQPIPKGNRQQMHDLCQSSPVPIALDEELIGVDGDEMALLLDSITPQYIVLKPSLCGGFTGADRWIELAKERNIGWWITSALESSLGLSALSQYVGKMDRRETYQGLGTGNLYENNLPSPLSLKGENLSFSGPSDIFNNRLNNLEWNL